MRCSIEHIEDLGASSLFQIYAVVQQKSSRPHLSHWTAGLHGWRPQSSA